MKRHWASFLPLGDIFRVAKQFDINPILVGAIVSVESGGQTFISRLEPGYKYLYKPEFYAHHNRVTLDTEINNQKTSWGLMQIMGATARELGFNGHLPSLCLSGQGLRWGCTYLEDKLLKYNDLTDAISAYNMGHPAKDDSGQYLNKKYVDKVLSRSQFLAEFLG